MANISLYQTDASIDPNDRVIGTDGSTGADQGKTKNYLISSLSNYFTNTITTSGDFDSFGSISVLGQTTVEASNPNSPLTLVAGANITLLTNTSNNSITIAASGGGSGGGSGTVTSVTSADTNLLTIADQTTAPVITVVTGSVASGNTGLITGGDVHSYIATQNFSANALSNVVEDTTPQLGGNLDAQTYNITTTGKILYSNVYSQESDLPNAATYHGMFAHVHATGAGYFAHGGNWVKLQNAGDTLTTDIDAHLNQNNPTTGHVLSWNGSDYAWVAQSGGGGGSYGDSDVDSHLNQNNPTTGHVLSWNGTDYAWVAQSSGSSYSNSDVDSHLNQNNPTSGYVLSWNGTDYAWVAQSGGGSSSVSITTSSPLTGGANNASSFTLGITQASNNTSGYLSSTDWNTFNNKVSNVTTNLSASANNSSLYINSSDGTNASVPAATQTAWGAMTDDDKVKLDGIAANAQVNVATNLSATQTTTALNVTSSTGTSASIPAATTQYWGAMTPTDKSKLDGIASNATSYSNSDVDSHLNQSNPTSGHVLSWNGSDYAWVAQQTSGGTVTGVTSGDTNTITIGGSSTAPTVAANTSAVAQGSANLATGGQIHTFVSNLPTVEGTAATGQTAITEIRTLTSSQYQSITPSANVLYVIV